MLKIKAITIVALYAGFVFLLCNPTFAQSDAAQKSLQHATQVLPAQASETEVHEGKIGPFDQKILRLRRAAGETTLLILESDPNLSLEVFVLDRNRGLIGRVRGQPEAAMSFRAEKDDSYYVVVRNRSPERGHLRLTIE